MLTQDDRDERLARIQLVHLVDVILHIFVALSVWHGRVLIGASKVSSLVSMEESLDHCVIEEFLRLLLVESLIQLRSQILIMLLVYWLLFKRLLPLLIQSLRELSQLILLCIEISLEVRRTKQKEIGVE